MFPAYAACLIIGLVFFALSFLIISYAKWSEEPVGNRWLAGALVTASLGIAFLILWSYLSLGGPRPSWTLTLGERYQVWLVDDSSQGSEQWVIVSRVLDSGKLYGAKRLI